MRLALQDEEHKSLFLNWLDAHAASVMKVARAYTLSSEDCQDLAQEILLQAWRSLPTFEGKANPATWFYRVALHTASIGSGRTSHADSSGRCWKSKP